MPGAETVVRRRALGRSIAFCAAVLTAASATPATAAPGGLAGRRAAAVPWRQAGPGWSVAEYSAASLTGAARPVRARTVFYLVSPAGRKWAFCRAPTATAYPVLQLDDWSGDRQRILVEKTGPGGGQRDVVEQISLATGTVISRFSLPGSVIPIGYTRPRGTSLLALGLGRPGIFRYDLAGHLQRHLAPRAYVTAPLDAPRGQFVMAGTRTGIDQISSNGAVSRRIRFPAPVLSCGAARWWTAATLLAACFGASPYTTSRLWLVPLGRSPAALTPALRAHGLFQGYIDAWKLASGLYLQADNAHDTLSVVRQSRRGARHTISIPGPAGVSDYILAASRGRLLLESAVGPGGPSSLFWFNPATRSIRFLVRAPAGVYGVAGAVPYGYRTS